MAQHTSEQPQNNEYEERVIQISRVSKKTKGGNKMGFSVLMVVGDKKGKVGVGLGKASDVVSAIRKGIKKAKREMINLPMNGTTIPFAVTVKKGAGIVMLKPAPKGSGVIAGGPVRAVVEAAGVRDISSKILGSQNQASSVYATFEALSQISDIVKVRGIKLRSIADIELEEKKKLEQLQEQAKANKSASKQVKTDAKSMQQPKAVSKKTQDGKQPAKKVVKSK
ncbi:MAG: 30S ribosomal protein S5 [Patescibacteria group bacterium]